MKEKIIAQRFKYVKSLFGVSVLSLFQISIYLVLARINVLKQLCKQMEISCWRIHIDHIVFFEKYNIHIVTSPLKKLNRGISGQLWLFCVG
jgi:hypothetical protein